MGMVTPAGAQSSCLFFDAAFLEVADAALPMSFFWMAVKDGGDAITTTEQTGASWMQVVLGAKKANNNNVFFLAKSLEHWVLNFPPPQQSLEHAVLNNTKFRTSGSIFFGRREFRT